MWIPTPSATGSQEVGWLLSAMATLPSAFVAGKTLSKLVIFWAENHCGSILSSGSLKWLSFSQARALSGHDHACPSGHFPSSPSANCNIPLLPSCHMDRASDLETSGDAKAFPVNECLECKLVEFSSPNTWSRFLKKEGRKRENNKALAYAASELPTSAFVYGLLKAEELKRVWVASKREQG